MSKLPRKYYKISRKFLKIVFFSLKKGKNTGKNLTFMRFLESLA